MIVSASAAGSAPAWVGDFSRRSSALLTMALKALMTWCRRHRQDAQSRELLVFRGDVAAGRGLGRAGEDLTCFDECPAKKGPERPVIPYRMIRASIQSA
jgi:hypothetical protein